MKTSLQYCERLGMLWAALRGDAAAQPGSDKIPVRGSMPLGTILRDPVLRALYGLDELDDSKTATKAATAANAAANDARA